MTDEEDYQRRLREQQARYEAWRLAHPNATSEQEMDDPSLLP